MKLLQRQIFMRSFVAMTALFLFLFTGSQHSLSFAHTKDESIYISGNWVEDEVGWRFVNQWNLSSPAGAWVEYQGNSYYFMDNGYMVTGWKYLNNHWYFFNTEKGKQEGAMAIGWVHDPNYNGSFYTNEYGILSTGWHRVSGSWYYFNQNQDGVLGLMTTNRMIDGSYVDEKGRMNEVR